MTHGRAVNTHRCATGPERNCRHWHKPWHYAERVTSSGGKTDLGPLLRTHREGRQMSQEQVAAASGIRRSTIQRIETSVRPMTPTEARFLADALGVSPRELGWP